MKGIESTNYLQTDYFRSVVFLLIIGIALFAFRDQIFEETNEADEENTTVEEGNQDETGEEESENTTVEEGNQDETGEEEDEEDTAAEEENQDETGEAPIEGTVEMILQRFREQVLFEGVFFSLSRDEFAVMRYQVDDYNRRSTEPEGTFYVFSPDRGYFETARVQSVSFGQELRVYDNERVENEKVLEFLNASTIVFFEMETLEEFMARIESDGSLNLRLKK